MNDPARQARLLAGVALGATLAVALVGWRVLPWGLVAVGLVLAWIVRQRLEARRPSRRIEAGLRAQWLELPGAELDGDVIHLRDGSEPVRVRLRHRAGRMRARLATPAQALPVAFRIWPTGAEPPPIGPEEAPVGGPPVERAAAIEARLAGLLHVETSDPLRTDRMLDAEAVEALLAVTREHDDAFEGLVLDGEALVIHLGGAAVADPERATRIARRLRAPFRT